MRFVCVRLCVFCVRFACVLCAFCVCLVSTFQAFRRSRVCFPENREPIAEQIEPQRGGSPARIIATLQLRTPPVSQKVKGRCRSAGRCAKTHPPEWSGRPEAPDESGFPACASESRAGRGFVARSQGASSQPEDRNKRYIPISSAMERHEPRPRRAQPRCALLLDSAARPSSLR